MSAKLTTFESMAESVLEMTDEEVLRMCKENGEDPEEIAKRMDKAFRGAIEKHKGAVIECDGDQCGRCEGCDWIPDGGREALK